MKSQRLYLIKTSDMKFNSKFNIGEQVYFLDPSTSELKKGEIYSITAYIDKNKKEYKYTIKPGQELSISIIPECFIFKSKDDVLDLCAKLTKDI